MTIETTAIKAVATGNGATTVWPFNFLIPTNDDLVLSLISVSSGNPTIISPVNYSVSGAGNPAGGSVTYPLSGSPVSAAYYVVIERALPLKQETDLQNQGAVYPEAIEDALDYLTMVTQQIQDQIDRSIVFSIADTISVTLPPAAARAGLFLGFGATGEPIAVTGLTPGATVSAAMIPVVTAPTTAAALTALGLPGTLLDLLIPSGTEWPYHAGGAAPTGFVYPIGQACTGLYPNYRAKLIAAGSPYGSNGVDPLMPDRRSTTLAGKSNMGGVDNGLLPGGAVLGTVLGSSTFQLVPGNIPDITGINIGAIALSVLSTATDIVRAAAGFLTGITAASGTGSATITTGTSASQQASSGTIAIGAIASISNNTSGGGSGAAVSRVQPTFIANVILKVH